MLLLLEFDVCIPNKPNMTESYVLKAIISLPRLVWLSGLSAGLGTERLPADSQAGQVPELWAGSPGGGVREATE